MRKSFNLLIIDNITCSNHCEEVRYIVCEFNGMVEFHCTITGKKFQAVKFSTKGKGGSYEEAIQQSLQRFLDGKFYDCNIIVYGAECRSIPHKGINAINVQLTEPFKTLVMDLFDNAKWHTQFSLPEHLTI